VTKYEEMKQIVEQKRIAWIQRNESHFLYMRSFVGGLVSYLGVPTNDATLMNRITFLRKRDGVNEYSEAEESKAYTLPGAISYCEEDEFWHLGLAITLTDPGTFPPIWYAFAILLREEGDAIRVRVGLEKKDWQIALDEIGRCTDLFERIADLSIEGLRERQKVTPKGIGFLAVRSGD
jgi:hypothetical protein